MVNTWIFKDLGNAAAFVGMLPRRGVDSVLIRTMRPINQEDFYAVHVTGNLDGITLPDGCEKPQTTSTDHLYSPSCRCKDCSAFRCRDTSLDLSTVRI